MASLTSKTSTTSTGAHGEACKHSNSLNSSSSKQKQWRYKHCLSQLAHTNMPLKHHQAVAQILIHHLLSLQHLITAASTAFLQPISCTVCQQVRISHTHMLYLAWSAALTNLLLHPSRAAASLHARDGTAWLHLITQGSATGRHSSSRVLGVVLLPHAH